MTKGPPCSIAAEHVAQKPARPLLCVDMDQDVRSFRTVKFAQREEALIAQAGQDQALDDR